MSELTIIKLGGGAYIDSREVAEFIGKDHRNLLRDIRGYSEIMDRSNALKSERINFFIESSYTDNRGREKPCYLLTKHGCELCANKLNGEKGVLFTAAYVTKFNMLEQQERDRQIAAQNKPRLPEFNAAVRNVLDGMSYSFASPERVMGFLRGVYNPLGIRLLESGDEYGFYSASEIARHIGVYSASGRPHGHAVAAIIGRLNLPGEHIAVVPYGLVGVTVRYDINVLNAVRDWLVENNLPHEVPYLDFEYHIHYERQLQFFYEPDDEYDDFAFGFELDE
jgi:Rha family phage regulatory protein